MRPSPSIPLAALLAALRPGQAFTVPAEHVAALIGVGREGRPDRVVFDLAADGSVVARLGRARRGRQGRAARAARKPSRKPMVREVVPRRARWANDTFVVPTKPVPCRVRREDAPAAVESVAAVAFRIFTPRPLPGLGQADQKSAKVVKVAQVMTHGPVPGRLVVDEEPAEAAEVAQPVDSVVQKAREWGTCWSKPGRLKPPAVDPAVKRLAGGA